MSFADYVRKRKSGEISAPEKEEKKPVETAGSDTGFAEYVKKRRSGEIPAPVQEPVETGIQFDRNQVVRRRQTNNPFQAAVESYNAGKVDLSKLKYRDGLNMNQTIGNAKGTFTPSTPEPANLTREGQWAAKHPLAGLGMYAVTNYIGGGEGVVNMLDAARREATGQGKIGANEINAAPLAQAYRTGASEGLRRYVAESNENLPKILRTVGNIKQDDGQYTFGEQALDFMTGVGSDAASSSLNMAMGGNLSTYLMGANAANQSLYDTANDEKTTSGQALALAAANGIAEAFFEKFSVENAGAVQEMFRQNPVSVKDFARTLLVSAGVEGSEEMNTEIANILSDIFIRGENSESGRMYARAIENGAEPNAAAAEVLRANLKQIGMAGLGGALSGGLHTGLYSSVGTMQRGMDLHNMTSAADIMDTIDTSTKEGQTAYDIASEIAKKEASGKRATAIDYGRLQNAINNAVEAASVPSTEETVPTTENTVPTTEEAVPTTDDVEIREAPRGDFLSTDAIRQTAENVRAQMDADYQEASNEMYGADTEGIKRWGGDVEGSKENKRSYHIPVETLVRIDEDNRNNKTYSGLGRYGQETFDAQSFGRDAYDSATSLYNSIRFGQDLTEAEKMRNARLLTDDQVFNISQAAFKDLNSFYNWDRAGKISALAEKHTLKDVTPGKVTYADGIDIDAIRSDGSKEGRIKAAQMAYAEGLLAKVFGYNVHWIQSRIDDNTGRYIDENGAYDPSTHTISLDINAGANYVGDTVAYVTAISHELTHTMELGAIDQYKKIADSIINVLVNDEEYARGRNAQQIIADMIENNPHVHNEADAIHELVAQACEDMLNGNRDIQEMLAGLDEAEQKSFFDRISDIFNSILQFIEDMLSSDAVKSDRREAEALRRAKEEIEGLRDTWNEGVKNAAIATKLADFGVVEGDGNVSVENSERSWSDTDKQKLLEALVPVEEVARMWKETLEGSDVTVPFNVVQPSLLKELEKVGIPIDYEGSPMYKAHHKGESKQYSTRGNVTSRDSEGTELTKEQQEYFKDSKVRDKDGNLMVVYHGTPRGDFTVFDNSKIGSSMDYGWYGKGFYFTDKESAAKYYAGYLRTSRVMKGYLNITNPYELKVPKGESIHRVMADAMGKIYDSAEEQAEAFTEWLKDNGYDGLITKGQYMVFDSNQFKNIDNENPTESPDIRYSLRESGNAQPAIKKQIESHIDELAKMESVADITTLVRDYKKTAREVAKRFGYKVDRKGFGIIDISESAINDSFKYATTDTEKAAYQALPYVLKHGINTGNHNDHKGRGLDTITFSAPITIDGVPCYMGAVVKLNKNRYKAHRVITIEGQKNITPNGRGVTENRSLANRKGDISNNRISQRGSSGNGIQNSYRDNTINGYAPSSIGSLEELMRYNSGIRDMSAGLAAALEEKGAQGAKLSDAQVERIARKFIKEYGSQADPRVIADGLKSMYEYIDATSKVSASQLGKIAHDYAREILNTASETDDTLGQLYPELRDGFKKAKLKLTDELKGDIVYNYDSIPNFKRQMRGVLDISEKGTQGVDTYYEELNGMYPDLFPDDIINPSDQLQRIAEVAEMLQKHTVKTDFGEDLDEVAYVLGQEMLAQYFAEKGDSTHKREVAAIKAEMTKKHQAEMAAVRADAAKEYQKLKDRLGSKAMKVAEVRAELNAMHRRVMERRELRLLTKEAKKRLMKQAKALWKLKGSAEFESAKRDLIGNLDLVSYGMSDGTRLNLEKIRKDALTQAAQDPDYAMSAEFADAQKLYERLNKQRISDMSLEQIESLTKAVLALKNSQQTYNRMLKEELGDYVADYGSRLITQQQLISGIRGKSHMMNALKRYALYMENPTRAAHLLDGYQQNGVFTELFDDINEGAIRAESFRQRADEMFRPVLEDKELTRTWSKQNIPIKVGSDTYYISKGMRIAIYLHSLNNDNMRHIKKGGFTIPDEKLYRQGRYTEAYAAGKRVPMSEGTVREIIAEMTPAERKFAGVAKEFFNSVTKDAINEVSLQLKGFELAMVNNYMPIRTNPNFTQREIEGLVRDASIEGAGQFKDRVPGASNPILLEDIAQAIKRQTDTTAKYYGLAIPVRNANKVWNFTSYRFNNSVKDAVAKNWLTDGAKIFENTLTDIQAGARRGDTGSHLSNLAKGAYATSVLMGNVGVSLKQSASYPLAIHMLDAASLAKGIVGKVDREYMDSITPLSWARRHGMGGQVEVADVFRQKGMIDDNPMLQKMKDLTNWIQAVDVATTDHLFVACEEYVKAHNPGLEVRGDEYNKMVADLYNSVLQRTQPSYGVMQRNELMRSSHAIMKALTMFKTQTFNMGGELLDAGLRVNALAELQKNGMATKADVADAKRKMVNVVGATILSQAMLAIIDVMGKALLHKMKPYRDEEGNVTLESVVAKTARDFGSSFFGLFFGLDVASQVASAFTGGKWYDVTAPQLDGINEAISATSKWSEALSKYMNGSGTKTDLIKQSGNMAIKISGAFGIPANNVYNIANAVNLWVQDVQTGKVGTFESGYGILGITDTSLTAKQYKDRLYRAVDQYGYGTKEYEKAMDELKRKTGKEEKEIFGSPYDDLYQVYREHGENSQEFKNRVKFLEEIGKKPKDIAKALNNRGATVTIK